MERGEKASWIVSRWGSFCGFGRGVQGRGPEGGSGGFQRWSRGGGWEGCFLTGFGVVFLFWLCIPIYI